MPKNLLSERVGEVGMRAKACYIIYNSFRPADAIKIMVATLPTNALKPSVHTVLSTLER